MDEHNQNQTKQTRSKNALLRYVAVLFAVAFLLVLLSYLVQMRNMNTTVSELNQTSSSALTNAQMLQSMNQQLMQENEALRLELDELKQQLDQTEDSLTAEQTQSDMTVQALQQELAALESAMTDAEAQHSAVLSAYELLSKAASAANANDLVALRSYMAELEPSAGLLGTQATRLYNALAVVMTASSAETGDTGRETGAETAP